MRQRSLAPASLAVRCQYEAISHSSQDRAVEVLGIFGKARCLLGERAVLRGIALLEL